jgi:hypothetical protein
MNRVQSSVVSDQVSDQELVARGWFAALATFLLGCSTRCRNGYSPWQRRAIFRRKLR